MLMRLFFNVPLRNAAINRDHMKKNTYRPTTHSCSSGSLTTMQIFQTSQNKPLSKIECIEKCAPQAAPHPKTDLVIAQKVSRYRLHIYEVKIFNGERR